MFYILLFKACADKLQREMEDYGYPPQFPAEQDIPKQEVKESEIGKDKSKSKKVIIKKCFMQENSCVCFMLTNIITIAEEWAANSSPKFSVLCCLFSNITI